MSRKNNERKEGPTGWAGFWLAVARVLNAVLDKFGWLGAFLIAVFYFVEKHATDDQKKRIIESYILGGNLNRIYPILVIGAVAVLILLAQWYYFKKRLGIKDREIDRLSEWKSGHQRGEIGDGLHSVQNRRESELCYLSFS